MCPNLQKQIAWIFPVILPDFFLVHTNTTFKLHKVMLHWTLNGQEKVRNKDKSERCREHNPIPQCLYTVSFYLCWKTSCTKGCGCPYSFTCSKQKKMPIKWRNAQQKYSKQSSLKEHQEMNGKLNENTINSLMLEFLTKTPT